MFQSLRIRLYGSWRVLLLPDVSHHTLLPRLGGCAGQSTWKDWNKTYEDTRSTTGKTLMLDGTARVFTTLFGELRNALFASISQGAIRKVARDTFEHLLTMDMKFHLERQTGGLTRAIDRGTK